MSRSDVNFHHQHAAHCESGVVSSLLNHYGLQLSEPMVFGISNSLNFAFLPFVRVGGLPLIAYRMPPGSIVKGVQKRLGVKMQMHRYRHPDAGMAELDRHLAAGHPVGLQTSVWWLPYFPPDMRFHFNAHNLVVFGRTEDGQYEISDPVFEHTVICPAEELKRARFVNGVFAPKGLLYYPSKIPESIDLAPVIRRSIRTVARRMLHAPLPWLGLWGIKTLAKYLARLDRPQTDGRFARLFMAQVVRMQEEIGTGGAGFRFMYASFLQEASQLLDNPKLMQAGELMTRTGDEWRRFAALGATLCRGGEKVSCSDAAEQLLKCGESEKAVYQLLLEATSTRNAQ